MKLAPITAALAAIIAAGSLATPTLAQDYRYGRDAGYGYVDPCTQVKHERTTSGGIIGALAGAAIGSSLAAHSGGRAGGAVLGALAGAAVGTNVGRDSAKGSPVCTDGRYGAYYSNGGYYAPASERDRYYYSTDRSYAPADRDRYGAGDYRYDRDHSERDHDYDHDRGYDHGDEWGR